MTELGSLTGRLGITNVYWVDDENASSDQLDLEKLLSGVAQKLADEENEAVRKIAVGKIKTDARARETGNRLDGILSADAGVDRAEQIERELGKLFDDKPEINARQLLAEVLSELPAPLNTEQKSAVIHAFDGIDGCRFQQISFAGWGTQKDTILRAHSSNDASALLIVDLQNSMESSPIDGESVLDDWSSALKANPNDTNIFAVALTSKFAIKEEIRRARALTNALFDAAPAPSLPVVGLSKSRMKAGAAADAVAAEMFIAALGRLRAFELHRKLSKSLGKEFSRATRKAFETLQQLSVEELVFSVSTTSVSEGASEAETLIRMAAIAQRQALSEALKKRKSIRSMLMELRGLQFEDGHSISAEDLETTDGIRALRCSEISESPTVVNRSLSPISTGDIFKIHLRAKAPGYFVVVSNACDLMLRGGDGARKLDDVLLIGLEENEKDSIRLFPAESELNGMKLKPNHLHTLVLPANVLDLCWANKRGKCTWTRVADAGWEQGIAFLPSQRKRFQLINQYFAALQRRQLTRVAPMLRRTKNVSADGVLLDQIAFSVKRVGRFTFSQSTKIARDFAVQTSRHPADHDFTP